MRESVTAGHKKKEINNEMYGLRRATSSLDGMQEKKKHQISQQDKTRNGAWREEKKRGGSSGAALN
jgi:hypothetical protein